MTNKLCLPQTTLSISIIAILSIILGLGYICLILYKDNIKDAKNTKNCVNNNDFLKQLKDTIASLRNFQQSQKPQQVQLSVSKYREELPGRVYTGRDNYSDESYQVGFIHNNFGRFPIYENRRGNDYYYHTIDDSRNRLRIVLNNVRKQQLFDKDKILVPELNNEEFNVSLYEYNSNKYNPKIL